MTLINEICTNINVIESGNELFNVALAKSLNTIECKSAIKILLIPLIEYKQKDLYEAINVIFTEDTIPLFIHLDRHQSENNNAMIIVEGIFKDSHLIHPDLKEIKDKITFLSQTDGNIYTELKDKAYQILKKYQNKFQNTMEVAYEEISERMASDEKRRQVQKHKMSRDRFSEWHFDPPNNDEIDSTMKTEMLKYDYADCMAGLISDIACTKSLKILLVDNHPDPFKKTLNWLSDLFGYQVLKLQIEDLRAFSDQLKEKNQGGKADQELRLKSLVDDNATPVHTLSYFDLILLDLHLGDDDELRGQTILKELIISNPEIPVFILSSIEDAVTIRETLQQGADYYVPKSRLISLPGKINHYFKELGKLLNYFDNSDYSALLRKNIVGNLRKWHFNQKILWFGDKCYHMIDHSYNHAFNDWKIANQLLPLILDELGSKKKDFISDEDLYALCMSIWLHDIGHKGNELYGEPHQVRDAHGLVSAELILKYPEHYGVIDFTESNRSLYRYDNFAQKSALQLIRDRIKVLRATSDVLNIGDSEHLQQDVFLRKKTILERIALLCAYHKSNFPIDDRDQKLIQKKKRIPVGCYENYTRSTTPIHLKSITDLMKDNRFIPLLSIFRFIDGLDINKNRVGDETEEKIKLETIDRDKIYQLRKLNLEVENLRDRYLSASGKEKRFFNLFYEKVEEQIESHQGVSEELRKDQQLFLDNLVIDIPMDNYNSLVEYIQFISVQHGHFKLHNAINSLIIERHNQDIAIAADIRLLIKYVSYKDRKYLNSQDNQVREWDQKEGNTIRDHLLGGREKKKIGDKDVEFRKKDSDGYVRKELNAAKTYIKDWFDIEKTEISIVDVNGKELHELSTDEPSRSE